MYVVIHIPEGIDHVMSFHITQACGVEDSSHFVKIRLFSVGCTLKLRRWARGSVRFGGKYYIETCRRKEEAKHRVSTRWLKNPLVPGCVRFC